MPAHPLRSRCPRPAGVPEGSEAAATSPAASAVAGRRYGDGRALVARYDPAADRTVVATTIGVSLLRGGDEPVVLREGLPVLLALSADGTRAAFTTTDGALEIWDLDAAALVATFDVPADRYTSLQFTSAGDLVAGGAADVSRFPVDGAPSEALVEAPADGPLGPVAVAADGAVAVPVGGQRASVEVWRPGGGGAAGSVDMGLADGTAVVGVVWSPDGRHLAVLNQPPTAGEAVGVWDLDAATFRGSVTIPNFVTPDLVAFAGPEAVVIPLPDRLAAFGLDGAEVDDQPIPSSEVARITAVDDGVVVGGWDGRLRRWSPGSAAADVAPATFNLVDVSVPAGVDELVTVDHYGTIRRLDVEAAAEVASIDRYAVGEATSIDVAADSVDVAVATSTGAVHVLRTSDGSVAQELDRPEGSVAAVAYAPNAPLLAIGVGVQVRNEVWDDTVAVTDLDTGATVTSFGGEEENVTGCSFFQGAVDFSPDGALLAATSHDFTVHVTATGVGGDDVGGETVLEGHEGTILDVEFSPDGALLATSSEDGTLRIWDVDGWTLRDTFTTTPGGYWSLAFTPDGSALGVSDVSGTVSMLDVGTGEAQRTFSGAKSPTGDMVFTPDGRRLVAGGVDGSVEVWSVERGAVEQQLEGHTMPVTDVAVTADGRTVVSSSQDGTARSWPLDA